MTLLKAGANPRVILDKGRTLLMAAILKARHSTLKVLLENAKFDLDVVDEEVSFASQD